MGIVDKMKQKLGSEETADKAKDKASKMGGEKASGLVDKGGDKVDEKTGGKASGQVDKAQDKAKDAVDKQMPGS
jgi:MT0933-like antitoxin protein